MIIKNGRVMDPSTGFDKVTDILIEDGKIKKVGKMEDFNENQVIDAGGLIVAPGLIDVHVHFREPGQTHKTS